MPAPMWSRQAAVAVANMAGNQLRSWNQSGNTTDWPERKETRQGLAPSSASSAESGLAAVRLVLVTVALLSEANPSLSEVTSACAR